MVSKTGHLLSCCSRSSLTQGSSPQAKADFSISSIPSLSSFHFLSSVLYLSEQSHGVLLKRLVLYQVTGRGQIDLPSLIESLALGREKNELSIFCIGKTGKVRKAFGRLTGAPQAFLPSQFSSPEAKIQVGHSLQSHANSHDSLTGQMRAEAN